MNQTVSETIVKTCIPTGRPTSPDKVVSYGYNNNLKVGMFRQHKNR